MYNINEDFGICGKCGNLDAKILKRKIEFDVDKIYLSIFSKCPECEEPLGQTLIYQYLQWFDIDKETCQKELEDRESTTNE